MLKALFVMFFVSFTIQAQAAVETREAVMTKVSFDGSDFEYQYTAYGIKKDLLETQDFACAYGTFVDAKDGKTKTYVQAIQFKVEITGEFKEVKGPFAQRKGLIDVRDSIESCIKRNPSVDKKLVSPVKLLFPQVSAPSRD